MNGSEVKYREEERGRGKSLWKYINEVGIRFSFSLSRFFFTLMPDRHYIFAFYMGCTGYQAAGETAHKQMLRLMFIFRVVYVGKIEKYSNEMKWIYAIWIRTSHIFFVCKCRDIKFDICAVSTRLREFVTRRKKFSQFSLVFNRFFPPCDTQNFEAIFRVDNLDSTSYTVS